MHVSLAQQVQQVEDTYEQLSLALGEATAADLFRKSVFFVSIGSNDFIHYYLRNVSGVQNRYLPWEFNRLLVNTMRQEIKVCFFFFRLHFVILLSVVRTLLVILVLNQCAGPPHLKVVVSWLASVSYLPLMLGGRHHSDHLDVKLS
jgi:hypothetical protein